MLCKLHHQSTDGLVQFGVKVCSKWGRRDPCFFHKMHTTQHSIASTWTWGVFVAHFLLNAKKAGKIRNDNHDITIEPRFSLFFSRMWSTIKNVHMAGGRLGYVNSFLIIITKIREFPILQNSSQSHFYCPCSIGKNCNDTVGFCWIALNWLQFSNWTMMY